MLAVAAVAATTTKNENSKLENESTKEKLMRMPRTPPPSWRADGSPPRTASLWVAYIYVCVCEWLCRSSSWNVFFASIRTYVYSLPFIFATATSVAGAMLLGRLASRRASLSRAAAAASSRGGGGGGSSKPRSRRKSSSQHIYYAFSDSLMLVI